MIAILAFAILVRGVEPNAADHYRECFALLPQVSEADKKRLADPLTAPLDRDTEGLLKRADGSLQVLHRATLITRCDWGRDLTEHMFDGGMDLCMKERLAGQFACLRARVRFEQGKPEEAVEDLVDAVTMARRLGHDGPFMPMLIQLADETRAVDVLAAHLPLLDAQALKQAEARLAALPPAGTLQKAFRGEKEWFTLHVRPQYNGVDLAGAEKLLLRQGESQEDAENILRAAGRDINRLRRLLDAVPAQYDELARIAGLPHGDFEKELKAYEERNKRDNPAAVSSNVLPLRLANERVAVRFVMLRAAFAALQDGKGRLQDFPDPFGDGPFTYEPFDGGFTLSSKMKPAIGPAWTLTVGRKK